MAQMAILQYPDPRLHKTAQSVQNFDRNLQTLVQNMTETMYEARGIGLAATQVDMHQRVAVVDVSEERDSLLVLVNPVITAREGSTEYEEGCLSIPGIYGKVTRAERIGVDYQDANGNRHSLQAEGLLAICIQHEIDHLDGKLFIQYLSPLKQSRINAKIKKRQRDEAQNR